MYLYGIDFGFQMDQQIIKDRMKEDHAIRSTSFLGFDVLVMLIGMLAFNQP